MTLHERFLTARSQAKSRASGGMLSEETLTQILAENGVKFQISGARVYPAGDLYLEIHVQIWVQGSDESEVYETYSVLVHAADMDLQMAIRHGAKQAKHLFLECKLGVNVGENPGSLHPFPTQQSTEVNQINQLAAATI